MDSHSLVKEFWVGENAFLGIQDVHEERASDFDWDVARVRATSPTAYLQPKSRSV